MMPILLSPPGAEDVGGAQHLDEVVGAAADPRLPAGDLAHRLLERLLVARDIAQVTLTAVRPEARASAMTRSESVRRLSGVRLLVAVIGVGEAAERIDDDRRRCAGRLRQRRRTEAARWRRPWRGTVGGRRNRAQSSSGISSGLIGRKSDAVVAPAALHREEDGAQDCRCRRSGSRGDDQEIGEPARRDHAHRPALAHRRSRRPASPRGSPRRA